MLSLSPRYDLFRFILPKQFLPQEVQEKYMKVLRRNAGVITTPIDYLNESIVGIHIPGISNITTEQQQHETNRGIDTSNPRLGSLGRIAVEPQHTTTYKASTNPLEKIDREFKVTFRMNQGLFNYFMLYETILYRYGKHTDTDEDDILYVEVLDEDGVICGRIIFKDTHIDGLDGLDVEYNKTTRDSGTFDLTFKFNNIAFEFAEEYNKAE